MTVRSESYRLHELLADHLGQPRYASGYSGLDEGVTLDDGRSVVLESTSNAGFRGIEGHFVASHLDGSKTRFTTSLGHVLAATFVPRSDGRQYAT